MPKEEPLMKSVTVIARPRDDCNIGCRYCYVPDEIKRPQEMSTDTAYQMMDAFAQLAFETPPKGVRMIWHGGEPLLIGLEFYREAVEMQREIGKRRHVRFENTIQTNGTLVDEQWARFLKRHDFHVGVSIDGPRELNDRTRVYKDGRGTYSDIVKGIRVLRSRGNKVGAIATISDENVSHMEDIYNMANSMGMSIKINPVTPCDNTVHNHITLDQTAFTKSAIRLFDEWIEGTDGVTLDFAESIVGSFAVGTALECRGQRNCQQRFIAVGPGGDIYPCSRFFGHEGFRYGNVTEGGLQEALRSPQRAQFAERYDHLDECQECDFTDVCYGSCPHTAVVAEGTIFVKDPLCEGIYRPLYRHISGRVIAELEKTRASVSQS